MTTKSSLVMNMECIDEQLKRHEKFLNANDGVYRSPASFENITLYNRNFRGINLSRARFYGARLSNINFSHANLAGADFEMVTLDGVNFSDANLAGANFDGAYFVDANLNNADMQNASLEGTRFEHVIINKNTNLSMPLRCPSSGSFVGWKKARYYKVSESAEYHPLCIVKLLVPEDAKRSSAFGNKCRCDKAIILGAYDYETGRPLEESAVIRSMHAPNFTYCIGDTITILNFDDNRWEECSSGFHFFIDEESAKDYWW